MEGETTEEVAPAPPRRFTGRKKTAETVTSEKVTDNSEETALVKSTSTPVKKSQSARVVVRKQIPDEILNDENLNAAISVLPKNYNFEVHKTVWRLRQAGAKSVALQFPEGLLMFALTLADIFESFAGADHCFILGDVAYGACCVDDFSAVAMGADFLVHYGHSCLVPVDLTPLPTLYVFVDILFDAKHLMDTIRHNFPPPTNLALAGTIQFSSALSNVRAELSQEYPSLQVPQSKPLSPGEVLGCTAPVLNGTVGGKTTCVPDTIVFIADGRFHLEAIMIANPSIPAFRYDPYLRALTREEYDHIGMRETRRRFVERARGAQKWGVVLGTLGRQGNPNILKHLEARMKEKGLCYQVVLLSELTPIKIEALKGIDAWVQIACPRLSIDWGEGFCKPVLTPFEAEVCLGGLPEWWEGHEENEAHAPYPMNYYEKDAGPWTSSYAKKITKDENVGKVLPHKLKKKSPAVVKSVAEIDASPTLESNMVENKDVSSCACATQSISSPTPGATSCCNN